MNQNRYKASFPTPNLSNEFFDSSTWVNYGFWAMLVVILFAHGIMYYHPDTGYVHEEDLIAIGINVVGLAILFILKLFAQNIYIVGKFISIACYIVSLSVITVMIFIIFESHFPIAYFGSVFYFGFAGYLLNKDYNKLNFD